MIQTPTTWTRRLNRLRDLFHSDFAFRRDTTLRSLPLVVAFLTLLSICMTHGAAYMKQVTLDGSESLSQRLHLHIPHETSDKQVAGLYNELGLIDGIGLVEEIPPDEVQAFLSRWLGVERSVARQFPVPTILDITLSEGASREIVRGQIQYQLDENMPDALLESYDESIAAFNRSSDLIKTGIYILGFIVITATTLIVVITSRINLGVHRNHIRILHDLGASDNYINRQFLKRSGVIALQGVLLGTALAVVFIELLKSQLDLSLLPTIQLELHAMWIYYLINPLLLVFLIMVAAWVSIEAQLRELH